jgi:hypothetical protein
MMKATQAQLAKQTDSQELHMASGAQLYSYVATHGAACLQVAV